LRYQLHGDGNDECISCPINVLAVFKDLRNEQGEDMQRAQQKLTIAIQSKTKTLRNELLKDRELKRIEQLKINAEIRRRAMQVDQSQTGSQNNG
jgi:hypothetical protein